MSHVKPRLTNLGYKGDRIPMFNPHLEALNACPQEVDPPHLFIFFQELAAIHPPSSSLWLCPQVRVAESPATAAVSIACFNLSPQRVEIPMLIPQERVKTKLHLIRPKRRMRQEIIFTAQGSRVSSNLRSLSLGCLPA